MGDTAVLTVLDEIEARLGNITTANGYFSAVDGVIARGKLTPWDGADLPTINLWATGFDNERSEYGGESRDLKVFVEIHDSTYDSNFIDVANKLAADVVTAICRATTAPMVSDEKSLDLGGIVEDILLDGVDFVIGEGQKPFCGALCRFSVVFHADLMDMFTIVNA